jgi:hypothetical protein
METLLQSITATAKATGNSLGLQNNNIARKSVNIVTAISDSIINWVALHPRTALVVTIFIFGFLVGLLF